MKEEYKPTPEQVLRKIMISELETINDYECLKDKTEDQRVKDTLDYIIDEEKEHFQKAEELLEFLEPESEPSEEGENLGENGK